MHVSKWVPLVALAHRHHGVVTLGQMTACGLTRQEVRTSNANGLIERQARGVYSVTGCRLTWKSRLLVQCESVGGRAFGTSAAMLHRLGTPGDITPGYAEIIVPGSARPKARDAVRFIRSDRFPGRSEVDGVPCLGLVPTIVSVGLHHRFEVFRAVVNEACRTRRTTAEEIVAACESHIDDSIPNSARLRAAITSLDPGATVSLSEWSDRFADWCVGAGLPRPTLEHRVLAGDGRFVGQVDLCWPEYGLVVELDSREFHFDAARFESDRRRYSQLTAQGLAVVVVTWKRWTTSPTEVLDELVAVLHQRGWTPA